MSKQKKLREALAILGDLGMPRPQINERTALCLLALVNMAPSKKWNASESPLIGITPIMNWAKQHYDTDYAPNTRETFRRQSMHQFIEAGVCLYNPDKPDRPVNSPHAVYQIEPSLQEVLMTYGTGNYAEALARWKKQRKSLVERYAKVREMQQVSVKVKAGHQITLSPGAHSDLIREIVESFGPRYARGGAESTIKCNTHPVRYCYGQTLRATDSRRACNDHDDAERGAFPQAHRPRASSIALDDLA